jgi:hypothetical protein
VLSVGVGASITIMFVIAMKELESGNAKGLEEEWQVARDNFVSSGQTNLSAYIRLRHSQPKRASV